MIAQPIEHLTVGQDVAGSKSDRGASFDSTGSGGNVAPFCCANLLFMDIRTVEVSRFETG